MPQILAPTVRSLRQFPASLELLSHHSITSRLPAPQDGHCCRGDDKRDHERYDDRDEGREDSCDDQVADHAEDEGADRVSPAAVADADVQVAVSDVRV